MRNPVPTIGAKMSNHRLLMGVSALAFSLAGLAFAPSAAFAQTGTDAPQTPSSLDDVLVFGQGQSRQQASVT